MEQMFRLALVQSAPVKGDAEANLAAMADWTERAAGQGAELVCFPELSVCGYSRTGVENLAEAVPGPSSRCLQNMAAKHRIAVLAGLIEQAGAHFYITHLVVCPDGKVWRYRKTHLGQREREVFKAGDALPVFTLDFGRDAPLKIAVGLCYDLHFPELAAAYAVQGAQLLLAPHASPHDGGQRLELWKRYLGARAYDNTLYVAACNHVQALKQGGYSGGMGVWDYRAGGLLAQRTEAGEGMLVADLDLAGLGRSRALGRTFFLKDRRPELYR